MMSSHYSMNIVFKCLSKGAVDFLVKPIRKNELKNLWQHVWRKCHSVSCYSYPTLCMKLCWGPILHSELQICSLCICMEMSICGAILTEIWRRVPFPFSFNYLHCELNFNCCHFRSFIPLFSLLMLPLFIYYSWI